MSRTTIIKCDKCGKEIKDEEYCDLYTVGIVVNWAKWGITATNLPYNPNKTQDWCGNCVQTVLSWFPGKQDNSGFVPEPLTTGQQLENLIRELAREETTDVEYQSRDR